MYFSFNTEVLPHISFMNKFTSSGDWIHPKRNCEEYILFIVLSGELCIAEDDYEYTLKQGEYIFLQPYHTHYGFSVSECEYYYIHFQSKCLDPWNCSDIEQICDIISENNKLAFQCDPFSEDLYSKYKLFFPKHSKIYSQSIFQQICTHMNETIILGRQQTPHYKLICSSRFVEILIAISRDFVANLLPAPAEKIAFADTRRKVYSLINYLNLEYSHPISSDDIAYYSNLNFDYLNRVFKQETGMTIFAYLKQVRLNHARELLSTSQLKLSEISEQTGFCDQYYFSRAFKQEYGVSPKKYIYTKNILTQKNGDVD